MFASSRGSSVTTLDDRRITRAGRLLRRTKLDEVPQLANVLRGEMALVGPRPDIAGFADCLEGDDRAVLSIRPGITGPATLLFSDEESLLSKVDDPLTFNADVLYPLKTSINRSWVEHGTLMDDIRLLIWTVKRPSEQDVQDLIRRWAPDLQLDPTAPAQEKD